MYRCDYNVKCISGSVTRIDNIEDKLVGNISRIEKPLKGDISCCNKELSGYIGIVCSVSDMSYLRVTPDIIWLTPDMISGEFNIYSNAVWKID